MTGQFVFKGQPDGIDLESLVKQHPVLKPHRGRLQRVLSLLRGDAKPRNDAEYHTMNFLVGGDDELEKVGGCFAANIERLAETANVKYRHNRARCEAAFREEIMGRVSITPNAPDSPGRLLLELVARMRAFWAFCGVYWFVLDRRTGALTLVARANQTGSDLVNLAVGKISISIVAADCQPSLFEQSVNDGGGSLFPSPLMEAIRVEYLKLPPEIVPETAIPDKARHFFVPIDTGSNVDIIVFARRDEEAVSRLRPQDKGGVSPICRHAIQHTCDEVVRALRARQTFPAT